MTAVRCRSCARPPRRSATDLPPAVDGSLEAVLDGLELAELALLLLDLAQGVGLQAVVYPVDDGLDLGLLLAVLGAPVELEQVQRVVPVPARLRVLQKLAARCSRGEIPSSTRKMMLRSGVCSKRADTVRPSTCVIRSISKCPECVSANVTRSSGETSS